MSASPKTPIQYILTLARTETRSLMLIWLCLYFERKNLKWLNKLISADVFILANDKVLM